MAVARSAIRAVKEVALLSGTPWRQDTTILLAILSLSEKIGGMMGATLSDILWANALPNPPTRYLNGQTILSAERVHPRLAEHLAYPRDSEHRRAMLRTYDTTQRTALIVAGVAMIFSLVCVLGMEDVDVEEADREMREADAQPRMAPTVEQMEARETQTWEEARDLMARRAAMPRRFMPGSITGAQSDTLYLLPPRVWVDSNFPHTLGPLEETTVEIVE